MNQGLDVDVFVGFINIKDHVTSVKSLIIVR